MAAAAVAAPAITTTEYNIRGRFIYISSKTEERYYKCSTCNSGHSSEHLYVIVDNSNANANENNIKINCILRCYQCISRSLVGVVDHFKKQGQLQSLRMYLLLSQDSVKLKENNVSINFTELIPEYDFNTTTVQLNNNNNNNNASKA